MKPEPNSDTDFGGDAPSPVISRPWFSRWLRGLSLVGCAMLGMLAGNLWMTGGINGWEATREVSDDDYAIGRFERFFRNRLMSYEVSEVGKNHEAVRSAFADVILESNRSTVRILTYRRQIALGTIVESQGIVLTKMSELARHPDLICQLHDGREFPARIVGQRPRSDLALLKLELPPAVVLPAGQFEDSEPLLGDWLAVPGGRGDEPIVVGVASSLPHEIKRQQGLLGVFLGDDENGAIVEFVIPDSSAAQHGIQAGDVIFAANGKRIRGREQLQDVVGKALPGDRVEFGIRRLDREILRKVTLGQRSSDGLTPDPDNAGHEGGPLSRRRSGFDQVIQHDCPLRPNQCGGPLVNVEGKIVGLNIARASRIESFALPARIVRRELDTLLRGANNDSARRNQ